DRLSQYAVTVRASGAVNVWPKSNNPVPFGAVSTGDNSRTLDISYDNKRVLVASDKSVQVFDYDSLKSGSKTIIPLLVYKRDTVHFACAEFSPGDSLIAIACSDRSV